MILTLKYFGLIAEMLRTSEEKLQTEAPLKVSELRAIKEKQCPELAQTDYRVAVNQKLVNADFEIEPASEIAFLPPFAGG